jgi:Holliday junction DNA helicase RuvA
MSYERGAVEQRDRGRRGAAMIALLRGEVAVRRTDHVVILCGGVGYRAAVSAETLRHVPAVGATVSLHTHLIVRDDAIAIYGFHSEQERDLFLMLLGVQAVGPKMAIAVLSGGVPRELLGAIAAGDARRFTSVPGIGRRTAERIIVELREKASLETGQQAAGEASVAEDPVTLARAGLLELGYGAAEAERLLAAADGASAEELIAQALRAARTT